MEGPRYVRRAAPSPFGTHRPVSPRDLGVSCPQEQGPGVAGVSCLAPLTLTDSRVRNTFCDHSAAL